MTSSTQPISGDGAYFSGLWLAAPIQQHQLCNGHVAIDIGGTQQYWPNATIPAECNNTRRMQQQLADRILLCPAESSEKEVSVARRI